jgi:hypothetical protein
MTTGICLWKGSEINQNDYSPNSSVGAERLLYGISELFKEKGISASNIKGYYASLGIAGMLKDEIIKASEFVKDKINEKEQEVYLYGYSQGGSNIVELANKLYNIGINVKLLFTVDAFNGLNNESEFLIPENVFINYNYYQIEPGLFRAKGGRNKAINKNLTTIKNYFIDNSTHDNIDENTINYVISKINIRLKAKKDD